MPPKISILYLGIVHCIFFPFMTASNLHFLRHDRSIDPEMFNPRILFTGSVSNVMDLDAKFGVEFFEPETFICKN